MSDVLERELRAMAAEVEWPPTPDLAAAVAERIDGIPQREPARLRPRLGAVPGAPLRARLLASPLALAAVILLVLLAAAFAVPPARSAILRVLGLTHGAEIVRVQPPLPKVSRGPLDLGRPMPLAQARRRLAFAVRLPSLLGPPRLTRYSDRIAGGAVTLSWLGYVLTEFEGQSLPFLQKFVTPKTKVRRVRIAGAHAYFLSGAPHELVILDRNRQPITGLSALVHANVLLWDAGGLSYRLETRHGLQAALAVANSLRR
jgi:hypothetical protein